jgi:hypothetical protein
MQGLMVHQILQSLAVLFHMLPVSLVAKLTAIDGTVSYVGVAEGSTPKSSRSILVKPGDQQCGTSGSVNGQTRSLSRCGSIKIITYFN